MKQQHCCTIYMRKRM